MECVPNASVATTRIKQREINTCVNCVQMIKSPPVRGLPVSGNVPLVRILFLMGHFNDNMQHIFFFFINIKYFYETKNKKVSHRWGLISD